MRFNTRVVLTALQPAWVFLVLIATLAAAAGGLWVGLQQDGGETSTSFVFSRRVGFLDRPVPDLEDHLNEIVNSVEFPEVFARIEDRLLLEAGRDYTLEIGIAEDTQSIVQVVIDTNRTSEADRISRIVAEEMVSFVLTGQDLSIQTEIIDLEEDLVRLQGEQARLTALAGGVPPNRAVRRFEAELAGFASGRLDEPVGAIEAELREQVSVISPLANEFDRNEQTIDALEAQLGQTSIQRLDITSGLESINEEWYRAITPPEPTSNVPVAIAMAFAAAVPALIVSTGLVLLNVAVRLRRDERVPGRPRFNDRAPATPAVGP